MPFNWDEYDYCEEDDFDDDDGDDDDFECEFIPGDGCPMVGTEHCEFECPYRTRLMTHPQYPHLEVLENGIIIPEGSAK